MGLGYSRRVGPPIVSAAVATLVLTNFAMVMLAHRAGGPEGELFSAIWPVALTSAVAVIMVMSFLFKSIADLVSEIEEREAAAQHQALHDTLTGLANRALLEDRLGQALHRHRRSGEQVALLMLDLDHFKQVNDTLGHPAGDELVRQVGTRLRALLRDTDTVARIGGDEFAIVQARPKGETDVRRLCERIIETIREPFQLGEREARVGVSIGAVFASEEAATATELLRHADITMYRAKSAGRDCYRLFTEAMDADVQRRDQIEAGLRMELENGTGPTLHFQPVIGADGELAGFEGLMRWTHSSLGPVSPSELVPVAEESGLMDELGRRVLAHACAVARRWPELRVAINISPAQFRTTGFVTKLKAMVESHGVRLPTARAGDYGGAVHQRIPACASRPSRSCARRGFRCAWTISAPGFRRSTACAASGSTRSSWTARSSTPPPATRASRWCAPPSRSAHAMDMEVVAEGIASEDEEQIALEAGCDGLQGYFYARPMPLEQLDAFLRTGRAAASATRPDAKSGLVPTLPGGHQAPR
jgi:diguanylate cyclase (GGDEF)-like protein